MESGSVASSEFEQLLQERVDTFRPGKVVKGTVAGVGKEVVTIDIGFKADGLVPVEQYQDADGKINVKPGDATEVFILALESDDGHVLISREKAQQKKVWSAVEEAFKVDGIITGKVVQKVKGGLQVDIGIPAFLPGSQIDIRPHRNLDKFIGQTFDFKILKITREKGNIVLSRRAVLVSERDHLRAETMKVLAEGVVMEGAVKNITEYGAFIDLGGVDGLVHISDISWGRLNHPSEKLSVGQTVQVVVLKFDRENSRVSLGIKQLKPDPWTAVGDRFPVGGQVNGKVTGFADYGAFVELDEGVEGLVHISEMSWAKKAKHPSKIVSIGDAVKAIILGIDAEQKRINLGMKQLMDNPWDQLLKRYPRGSRITGKVRSITDFGIFVGLEEGVDGLVHISDFSWTKRIKDPQEIHQLYKKGDTVEAVVLDIDPEHERLSLGVKQLATDPWETIATGFPVGSRVKGKISAIAEFGVFVEIGEGIEGLIHNSQLVLDKNQTPQEVYQVGQVVESEVINIDRDERRISLSVKAIRRKDERKEMAQFMDDGSGRVTFGDLMSQLKNKDDD